MKVGEGRIGRVEKYFPSIRDLWGQKFSSQLQIPCACELIVIIIITSLPTRGSGLAGPVAQVLKERANAMEPTRHLSYFFSAVIGNRLNKISIVRPKKREMSAPSVHRGSDDRPKANGKLGENLDTDNEKLATVSVLSLTFTPHGSSVGSEVEQFYARPTTFCNNGQCVHGKETNSRSGTFCCFLRHWSS